MAGGATMTAAELARQLRVSGRSLRAIIRDARLVPDHQARKHYALDASDVARITAHPAVRALPRSG